MKLLAKSLAAGVLIKSFLLLASFCHSDCLARRRCDYGCAAVHYRIVYAGDLLSSRPKLRGSQKSLSGTHFLFLHWRSHIHSNYPRLLMVEEKAKRG